jgi:hypothetical protein
LFTGLFDTFEARHLEGRELDALLASNRARRCAPAT